MIGELRSASAFVFVESLDEPAVGPEDSHHLLEVLRLRDGEAVVAADGRGHWRTCTLARTAAAAGGGRSRRASAVLVPAPGEARTEAEAPVRLGIGFAMTKGERSEWTVQKLTELGIDEIWPFFARRSVVRLGGDDLQRRGDRLRRIAREAAAQSRRPRLPVVHDPVTFTEAAAGLSPLGAVALAEPGSPNPGTGLTSILVGPEGGWAPEELAALEHHVGLGDGILRSETAAVLAAGILTAVRSGCLAWAATPAPRAAGAREMH